MIGSNGLKMYMKVCKALSRKESLILEKLIAIISLAVHGKYQTTILELPDFPSISTENFGIRQVSAKLNLEVITDSQLTRNFLLTRRFLFSGLGQARLWTVSATSIISRYGPLCLEDKHQLLWKLFQSGEVVK